MCGIVAIVDSHNCVAQRLLLGLRNLEYRGYDSAGVALCANEPNTITQSKQIAIHRHSQQTTYTYKSLGSTDNLCDLYRQNQIKSAYMGLGHTRWATHGKPAIKNTHPLRVGSVSVVHNGTIDNYEMLKKQSSYGFHSDTDTEALAALIEEGIAMGLDFAESVSRATRYAKGMYSAVITSSAFKNQLIGVCQGLSLLVAKASCGAYYLVSDLAGVPDGNYDITIMEANEMVIVEHQQHSVVRASDLTFLQKSSYYSLHRQGKQPKTGNIMYDEIGQQPAVLQRILNTYLCNNEPKVADIRPKNDIKTLCFIACGTSYNAALMMRYLYTNIQVNVEIASEFAYENSTLSDHTLYILISQSGETADVIQALRRLKSSNIADTHIMALINAEKSYLARKIGNFIPILSGNEAAVASTKVYTAQMLILLLLGQQYDWLCRNNRLYDNLFREVQSAFALEQNIANIALQLAKKKMIIFSGRSKSYCLAVEGCLKMQELSYIPCLAIAAGELRHGPLALIDEDVAVIMLDIDANLSKKTKNNAHEIVCRQGELILIGHSDSEIATIADHHLTFDRRFGIFAGAVILQLLSYHVAKALNRNVDRPRNLAKSITVE